jgi:DNA-binding beta-propeller fold protein YncE
MSATRHLLLAVSALFLCLASLSSQAHAQDAPTLRVDPFWPKPLPNNWILGQIAGVAVDEADNIWIVQRPHTLTDDERGATLDPPRSRCCIPAPPVIVFDQEGNVVKFWGGPGDGYEWPANAHGIQIDPDGNVWIGGNAETDGMALKFTQDGEFLMQIGNSGPVSGSADTTRLGRPANFAFDDAANEVYIADGYGNHRVIVFDADTGDFKRLWGAYGNTPSDAEMPTFMPDSPQFANPVHCVRIAEDGLVYVCDRSNNRLQVFTKQGEFVRQFVYDEATRGSGSVWDIDFLTGEGQPYIVMVDGTNNEMRVVRRDDGTVTGTFGRAGRYAGEFHWVHNIAVDSHGNAYTTEVDNGKRVQRFLNAAQ